MEDAYQILRIARNARPDEITRAFHRERVLWNPERHGGSEASQQKMKAIHQAYEVLMNPVSRTQHDAVLPPPLPPPAKPKPIPYTPPAMHPPVPPVSSRRAPLRRPAPAASQPRSSAWVSFWPITVGILLVRVIIGSLNDSPGKHIPISQAELDSSIRPLLTGEKPIIIHDLVDVPPTYPGGPNSLRKYLHQHLRQTRAIPLTELHDGVQIRFIIDTNGTLSDIRVTRSYLPECDSEALRIVRQMPPWNPAEYQGQKVWTNHSLWINFRKGHYATGQH